MREAQMGAYGMCEPKSPCPALAHPVPSEIGNALEFLRLQMMSNFTREEVRILSLVFLVVLFHQIL